MIGPGLQTGRRSARPRRASSLEGVCFVPPYPSLWWRAAHPLDAAHGPLDPSQGRVGVTRQAARIVAGAVSFPSSPSCCVPGCRCFPLKHCYNNYNNYNNNNSDNYTWPAQTIAHRPRPTTNPTLSSLAAEQAHPI